ncbi:hypothetical protein HYR54_05830 [Candidatus Acetothermia bacterium]|nr:hypothetical protein [Candidatus Acetothermia bacterium]
MQSQRTSTETTTAAHVRFAHISLTDPKKPLVKTLQVNGESWDVKIEGNFLYVAMNYSTDGTSLLIYDISDAKNPQLKSALKVSTFAGVHNVFARGKVVFMATYGAAGSPTLGLNPGRSQLHIADVSDPANPIYLGVVDDPAAPGTIYHIHDMTVIGNRAYLAGWNTGFWILDFENLDNPKQGVHWKVVGHNTYRSADDSEEPFSSHTHNVWPSPDGKILFTTDETGGDYLRAWDISNLSNIHLLGEFRLNSTEIAHNVVVDGAYAYIAYYTAGLHVLDYSNPSQLKDVAFFDTDPRPVEQIVDLFSGAWSVFPFGKYILVGDMEMGLFVFEKKGILAGKS